MKTKNLSSAICIQLIFTIFTSCGQNVPPEKFIFDSKFDSLFKAISHSDTMFFENSQKSIDTFVLTKIDSVITDRINCFMCPQAGKSIFRNYKQYPVNQWAEHRYENQGTSQEKSILSEATLVTISKIPDNDLNTAYLSFKNFHCSIKGSLGQSMNDTLVLNNRYFTKYYIFNSTAKSLIVNDEDVEIVFITLTEGIIAYKEKSGILRKRLL
jgi:hypothetical protein